MEITIQVTRTKLLNYQSAGLLFSRRIDSNNEGARRLSSVWRTAYENHLFCLWWRTHFAIAGITILVGDQLPPEVSSCRVGQRIVAKIVPPFHFVSSLLCVCVWLASEWSGAKASESVGPSERERRRRKRRMEKEREREREIQDIRLTTSVGQSIESLARVIDRTPRWPLTWKMRNSCGRRGSWSVSVRDARWCRCILEIYHGMVFAYSGQHVWLALEATTAYWCPQ